jgi:hypothetical protein
MHWEWRFVSYEATPAATERGIKAAVANLQSVAALREQLGVGDQEWARVSTYPMQMVAVVRVPSRDLHLLRAKAVEAQAKDMLNGTSYREWAVPAWAVAAAAGVLPVLWLAGWDRRRRLAREGRCPQCGYDLRAGHDRCPECGRAVAGAPAPEPRALTRPGTA